MTCGSASVALFRRTVRPPRRPSPARDRGRRGRQPARLGEGAAEQVLDLRVAAAQLVGRPAGEGVVHLRVEPQEDLFTGRTPRPPRTRPLSGGGPLVRRAVVHRRLAPRPCRPAAPVRLC
ncbi:hypothetical protein STTU_4391 [Streptomyces sp. Tu6071]|nr:hypothetical protein STTU_4391 [Streptomyces sp. Tu6071]